MLTRLEVSGFKNLIDLKVDLGPFNCIAGPNGTGKSNVFDVIHFLSLLAEHPIMEAAQRVRSDQGRPSDPKELLWTDGTRRVSEMRFVVEMIVSPAVTDDFGRAERVTSTFLRYELRLGYEPSSADLARLGRLVLRHESLHAIPHSDAEARLSWASPSFRDAVVLGDRAGKAFISTEKSDDDGVDVIDVHRDAGERPRPSPARTAPRTIVCTTTTASEPTILAARREMQGWRMLALEPTAMRSPDPFAAVPSIEPDGGHMAAALYRLAHAGEPEPDPPRVYATVASRLARLIDARELRVDRDDRRDLLTLELRQGTGGFLPARSLSDGTLRFLALSILDADPDIEGLVCMEEPENGIHPERLPAMVELLQEIAVDPSEAPGPDNPLRQVIVNTHSPGFVQLQHHALLFARAVKLSVELPIEGHEAPLAISTRVLRLRPLSGTWRDERDHDGVGKGEILAYLTAPPGAQLSLEELSVEPRAVGHAN